MSLCQASNIFYLKTFVLSALKIQLNSVTVISWIEATCPKACFLMFPKIHSYYPINTLQQPPVTRPLILKLPGAQVEIHLVQQPSALSTKTYLSLAVTYVSGCD